MTHVRATQTVVIGMYAATHQMLVSFVNRGVPKHAKANICQENDWIIYLNKMAEIFHLIFMKILNI